MTQDDTPKDARELKELTKVVRSIDLETKAPNETSMKNANDENVFYHPDFMPPHLKEKYYAGLMKPARPRTPEELAAEEEAVQKIAQEEWPIQQQAIVGDEEDPENDVEIAP